MRLPQPLLHGRFVHRLNRFAVQVRLEDGKTVTAHLPNSGRLCEILRPGNDFWLAQRFHPHRRTQYDVVLGEDGQTLVSVDARLPPKLLLEGIAAGKVRAFGKMLTARTEVPCYDHRLDLQLTCRSSPHRRFTVSPFHSVWWVETKSVTLVVNGTALFPDAPTVRGHKHLRLLTGLRQRGELAAVVFIVQRPDAKCFVPNACADPDFARSLQDAERAGVRVLAYGCTVTFDGVSIIHPLPVRFSLPNF